MKEETSPNPPATVASAKGARLRAHQHAAERLERRLETLRRTSYRFSWLRLIVFVAGLLLAGFAYEFGGLQLAILALVAAAIPFAVAVYLHRRLERGIERHVQWRELKLAQVARGRLDWERVPPPRPYAPRPEHHFEADLNLVGPRSLHHLLDTAVSSEGSERLHQWLSAPVPDREATIARQQMVRELAPLRRFRERLALGARLAGEDKEWRASSLLAWLDRPPADPTLGRWLVLLAGLAALDAALFVANQLGLLPSWWQLTFVVYLGLVLFKSRTTGRAWDEAMELQAALRQLRSVFREIEAFSFYGSPHLSDLCRPFRDPGQRPSAYLSRLTYLVSALSLRGNPLVHFAVNAVLPWEAFFAHRLERYRATVAPHAHQWLEVWFTLEALGSLANAAYLNPDHSFPEVVPTEVMGEDPVFLARALAHPLLPDATKIGNDFVVPRLGQVTLISGSNMAGKSVFMKTVAVNLVLAYAGGAVDARHLRTLPFCLFTSMAIADSVTDGISYFYAEVRRLKALLVELEREHPLPLLYAIDEIFRGTNNRERLIGGRAYVRALAGQNGVGLIATHDLELTRLGDHLPGVVNYHFRDTVSGDRMAFDYKLRPGPSPTTNALRLMRLQGLPVPTEDEAR